MDGLEQLCVAVYAQATHQSNPHYGRERIRGEAYVWRQWDEDEQRIVHGRVVETPDRLPEPSAAATPWIDLSFTHEPLALR